MSEEIRNQQSNINWLETFRMARKAPIVANRIFKTVTEAMAYVNNPIDSAIDGIRITILKNYDYTTDVNGKNYGDDDYIETFTTDDEKRAGVYYVTKIGDGDEVQGSIEKICRGDVAWYNGNAVTETETTLRFGSMKDGDMYFNTDTLDIFILTSAGWVKKGNIGAQRVDTTAAYYILSTDGVNHPVFSLDTWVKGNADGTNIPHDYSRFNAGQVYLWTRFYDGASVESHAKYSVALVYSTLNLGTFTI